MKPDHQGISLSLKEEEDNSVRELRVTGTKRLSIADSEVLQKFHSGKSI